MAIYSTKSDSNIFKKCRMQSGKSQREIASILGVVPSTLSKWETGVATPDQSILPRIADLYGVSVDYLLGRDDSFHSPIDTSHQVLLDKISTLSDEEVAKAKEYLDFIISQRK